jgi:type I restriction enzyme S subunit
MENSLPIGWQEISLDEIASYVIGGDWGKDSQEVDHEKIFVLRGTDYKNWDKIRAKNAATRYFKKQSIEKRQLTEGDIILEVSGGGPDQPVGRVVSIDRKALESVDGKLSFSNFFRLIRINKNINPYFVKAYLDYAYSRGDFNDIQTHTTNLRNLRVNEFLSKTMVPIPPLSEQQRLVAKLDELMEKIDRSRAQLERIPKILKRFRQSILSAAVSGKLTEEWRGKNKILDAWEEITLGKTLISLDQGWSPKCENFASQSEDTWGVIKTTAVQHMYFLEGENKQLPSHLKAEPKFELKEDDVLITRAGPRVRVGVCCHVKNVRRKLMICDKVYRLRVNKNLLLPGFIEILLNTGERVEEIEGMKTGISDSGVNLTQSKIKEMVFHLPLIDEQQEIVCRVEQLFNLADKIEARYNKAKVQLDRLPQSLLAKAFKGELLPQDSNGEPARALLNRIIAEKSLRPIKKTTTKEYHIESPPSIGIAAESQTAYVKSVTIKIPENKRAFAKQVLGGKIVSIFKDDPHFTHIKFQKLQYLAEHLAEVDLNWNYYRQSAGPYDPKFMHTVSFKLKASKWFEEKKYKFHPLEKADKIEGYYEGYFKPVATKLDSLFAALKQSTEDEAEIVATLYAVWNNMIIKKERINDEVIVSTFFEWSDRKKKYAQEQVNSGLQWMKKNGFVPTGFGKLIKEKKK